MKKTAFELEGKQFGKLTVLHRVANKNNKSCWLCRCSCGVEKEILGVHLVHQKISSCGCSHYDKVITHHKSRTPLYQVWRDIKKRCLNKTSSDYHNYGGRGISICNEWKNSFESFYKWAIKSGYSNNLTIDRIDNSGDYCPENCRWVSRQIQCNNTRRNHFITYNGETHTLSDWCKILGLNYYTVRRRFHTGCTSAEKILSKERWK